MEIPTEPIGSIPRPRLLIDARLAVKLDPTGHLLARVLGTAMAARELGARA